MTVPALGCGAVTPAAPTLADAGEPTETDRLPTSDAGLTEPDAASERSDGDVGQDRPDAGATDAGTGGATDGGSDGDALDGGSALGTTVRAFMAEELMGSPRREAFLAAIGSFRSARPAEVPRLRDVYGDLGPEALTAALDEDFDFTTRFGEAQPWNHQLRICDPTELTRLCRCDEDERACGVVTCPRPPSCSELTHCVDLNDTVDWLALQLALFERSRLDAGLLVIDKRDGDYVINQALSVPTGAHLEWRADTSGTYAFIYSVDAPIGSFFGPYNLFRFSATKTVLGSLGALEIVEDVSFVEPHLDGRFNTGDNGISFYRNSRGISVRGGVIRNLTFHRGVQSGRGFMCEQGCIMSIQGTHIEHASFGISAHTQRRDLTSVLHPDFYEHHSDIEVRDVTMVDVDAPFTFHNLGGAGVNDPSALQHIDIADVTIRNGGAITRGRSINWAYDYFSLEREDGSRGWCMNRTAYVTDAFDTENACALPSGGGVFYLRGGRNVTIRNVTIENDPSYPHIGGLVWGNTGRDVLIEGVSFVGRADAVFKLTDTGNPAGYRLIDATFRDIHVTGYQRRELIDMSGFPYSHVTRDAAGNATGCSPPQSNGERLERVVRENITYSPLAPYQPS